MKCINQRFFAAHADCAAVGTGKDAKTLQYQGMGAFFHSDICVGMGMGMGMGIDEHRMAHGLPHFCPMDRPEFPPTKPSCPYYDLARPRVGI